MARFVSPITDMKPNGYLLFFKSKTNTQLITYKDELESIQNTTNVHVLANGNVENVFYSGNAKVKYFDEFGQQYAERDPVGGEKQLGDFSDFDLVVSYDINDIVEGSDGEFYKSLSNGNIGNDPTITPTQWEQIKFLGVWNTNITYAIGDVVKTSTGNLWKALAAQAGNDPEADGGTNWIPAISGVKIPEVIALEDRTTTVIPQTGGGLLTALRVNELRDGDTGFLLPLANSVSANQTITITQPDEYVANEPIVTRSGSDTITDSSGTDTSITFDNTQSVELTLTSDGVSDWSL